jgi:hypothetical protein
MTQRWTETEGISIAPEPQAALRTSGSKSSPSLMIADVRIEKSSRTRRQAGGYCVGGDPGPVQHIIQNRHQSTATGETRGNKTFDKIEERGPRYG